MKPKITATVVLALLFKQAAAISTFTAGRDSIPSTAEQNSPSQPLLLKGALPVINPLAAVLQGPDPVAPRPSASPVVASEPQPAGRSAATESEAPIDTPPISYLPYFPAPSSSAEELHDLVGDIGIALALVAAAAILWA
ncbi:hypothetical protein F4820DRAFT_216384 [Hypoxylon rubiginosum]|uniref:Uncharacterized protein n=1 Tax=Hypoxylon rubiginosum TaxID=110542 RepID=A0ACB9YGK5_9PEZI|nr:hypothetical protein F4820DRAFT_216384 [Hypoxylon rubiginosum]